MPNSFNKGHKNTWHFFAQKLANLKIIPYICSQIISKSKVREEIAKKWLDMNHTPKALQDSKLYREVMRTGIAAWLA